MSKAQIIRSAGAVLCSNGLMIVSCGPSGLVVACKDAGELARVQKVASFRGLNVSCHNGLDAFVN